MKVLIVDDETLTREGLVSSIDWESLNIHKIFQADDGIHGLETARLEKPDIILSDVRMPRMDGIRMAEELRKILPDSSIIFMSGYSDKEYLKAAIKLKAISYVEKPIDPKEVTQALLEAMENTEFLRRTKRSETLQYEEKTEKLAQLLTYPPRQELSAAKELFRELDLPLTPDTRFTALIVKTAVQLSDLDMPLQKDIFEKFRRNASDVGYHLLITSKHDQFLIFQLFGEEQPSKQKLQELVSALKEMFSPVCNFHIAVGNSVVGIGQAYQSYNDAAVLLQSSFFCPYNSILTSGRAAVSGKELLGKQTERLEQAIDLRDKGNAFEAAEDLFKGLLGCQVLMPSQVKDTYYKLLMVVGNAYGRFKLNPPKASIDENIWGYIDKCVTLLELHQLLTEKLEQLFLRLEEMTSDHSTSYLIKEYIGRHYADSTLSVKSISEYVYRSTSYVCTSFKNETGQTLNQYLTEYRMEIAKQLLEDPRYKISDISSMVGYTDGNYFGKLFKKMVGLSPSEYREKMMQ